METMQRMEGETVDCIITDPPYVGFGLKKNADEYLEVFFPYVLEMLRCVRGRPDEKRIAISQPAGRKMELLHSNLPATHFVTIPDAFAISGEQMLTFLSAIRLICRTERLKLDSTCPIRVIQMKEMSIKWPRLSR